MDFSKLGSLFANGQFVAALATAVDAIAAALVAGGAIHAAPDAGLVATVITVAANAAAFVLVFIQHSQHTAKVAAAQEEKMSALYHDQHVAAIKLGAS
jgi:hypothetical protein